MSEDIRFSPLRNAWHKYRRDWTAMLGFGGIAVVFLTALTAPLLANSRPFIVWGKEGVSLPFLRYIFAPDSSEYVVEKIFNYLLIFIPVYIIISFLFKRKKSAAGIITAVSAVLIAIPFFSVNYKMDKTDWVEKNSREENPAIFAPVPFGPYQSSAAPYEKPSGKHILGTDQIGRDIFARMAYGARVSLAVGFLGTALSIFLGVTIGITAGYFGGKTDIIIMRAVEIIICFPTFLLLLILMAIMMDYKYEQSILLVILILGLTGWTGLSRMARGEVLKQRSLPYIQSCESLGMPVWRIMLFHLLPNITGLVLVSFTFSVAGFILAESGLSFLGFGVQAPTASWGELLRQAFADPFLYWHLTLWPGLALFVTVCSFNFAGEGLRKVLDPKS